MIELTLPYPPSVNKSKTIARGRFINTKALRDYKKLCGHFIKPTDKVMIPGDVIVQLEIYFPDKRRRDADNVVKATLDTLVLYKVIDDDSDIVYHGVLRAGYDRPNGRIDVRIEPFKEDNVIPFPTPIL